MKITRRRLIGMGTAAAVAVAAVVVFTVPLVGTEDAPALPELGRSDGSTSEARALAEPLGRFGFALLSREAAASEGNIVISPASIHAALSMVLNGARDQTSEEMRRALQVEGIELQDLNQAWADLITSAMAGKNTKLSIANSLWLRDGVAFEQPFIDLNRDYYAAELAQLAGDGDRAAADINSWVDERTHGKITELFKTIDPLTVLVVANTVYLKVGWEYFPEEDTRPGPFTTADGEGIKPQMMHGHMEAPVALTDAYDAIALATDGPIDVWVIVPKGKETPESVIEALGERGLAGLYESSRKLEGDLAVPRLSLEYETEERLMGSLEELGMRRAFDEELAQFEGIADLKPLWVQKIVHKATLDLNEEGVEAAAATGAVIGTTSMPQRGFDIVADRPFLVALAESGSRAPLFLSIIRDPR